MQSRDALKTFSRWLTNWLHRQPPATALPLGLSEQEVEALRWLASTPHWPRYLRAVEALAHSQVSELAQGLPHDRYLFTCGALTALRRVHALVDDVLTVTKNLKETENARARATAERESRTRNVFLNTPWYDQYIRDSVRARDA